MKSNKPKISVIMAVYNTEKYLEEAIDSILNQTFKDFELIIIDDKSTDNSLNIIKRYSRKDKRIIFIKNIKNLGSAACRNKGLEIAKGKYISIMDSDDISLPRRLFFQYKFLEENKDIFLLGTSWININEKGQNISLVRHKFNSRKIMRGLLRRCMIHQPTSMFRNEMYRYRGKFRYAQDRDLWLRFLSDGKKMVVVPKILIKYRINSNSVSIIKSFEQNFFAEKSVEFYYQRLKKGFDNYKSFNPTKELKKFNKSKINEYNLRANLIAIFKEHFGGRIFRKEIVKYWKKNGYFYWKLSIFYYVLSFMPIFIIKFCIYLKENIFY